MAIPSPVRCVLFDAVGTLIFADPPVSAVYSEAANRFGLTLDEATVEQRFTEAFSKYNVNMQDGGEATSEANERDRWRSIVAEVFPELGQCEELYTRLWEHFSLPASWRLYHDVADCWRRWSDRRVMLGIASNFDERLRGICRGLPPLDCEHVFMSSRLGWRKPAAQFFHAIEDTVALRPDELLLVGDDWASDCLGATVAGWQTVYLDRAGHSERPFAIRSLAELL
ncbi:MAG: HAD-IA family hydrolase [Pirellulales bacterium]